MPSAEVFLEKDSWAVLDKPAKECLTSATSGEFVKKRALTSRGMGLCGHPKWFKLLNQPNNKPTD